VAQNSAFQRHNPFNRLGELFDASALGIVTLMLLFASFYATWRGMQDFVASRASAGGVTTTGLVVLVVLTLTLAMYVALREMVNPIRRRNIFIAFPLYALLALWSIGFGYGFWWSLVAGQNATEQALSRSVESLGETTSELRAELAAGAALMQTAERLSEEKAQTEIERGGTCGIASGAGDGPLSRARAETRSQIAAFASGVQEDWLDPVDLQLTQLETLARAESVTGETPEARKQRMEALGQSVRRTAQDISADATVRGKILAAQLRAKAERLSVAPVSGAVDYCFDPDLATSLALAADALEGPFEIEVARFRFAEGADGVAQAVEDLWLGLFAKLGLVDRSAVRGAPLDGRSLIALVAAIGVDFALFVFALLRGGMRRGYEGEVEPPAIAPQKLQQMPAQPEDPVEGGVEEQPVLGPMPRRTLLPPKRDAKPRGIDAVAGKPMPRPRIEADPKAVGIGTTDADSHSQVPDNEQVIDLIRSVDGHYRAMSKDELIADREAEIQQLKAELAALKRRGYVATGRRDQMFDPTLHKQVGTQASDKPKGTIIETVRPGYITEDLNVFRIAYVIISSGPSDFDF